MRVITWNINRRTNSKTWEYLLKLNPDIALLQEVKKIPTEIADIYKVLSRKVTYNLKGHKFSTAVLIKGNNIKELKILSEHKSVNDKLQYYQGNIIACQVKLNNHLYRIVSVHSPAVPVNIRGLDKSDLEKIRLKDDSKLWMTELLWSALKNTIRKNQNWIVGGDYNSSETFDKEWQDKHGVKYGIRSSGNKEILDRMKKLGFTECLREFNGKIIPTFKDPRGNIDHQIDHLFVTNKIYSKITDCSVGDKAQIFGNKLSDHLPIIADYKN